MKRLLLFYAFMLTFAVVWAHDVEIDGIYYNLDETNKTAEVTYEGDEFYYDEEYSGSIDIPSSITINSETYSVISIGDNTFRECSGLSSITIPNSVTAIGSGAFSGCSSLTFINIPNSVTAIGSSAFSYCSNLTFINIPNSVTSIDSYAFNNCTGLTSITIPNSVTYIGGDVFISCSGLTEIIVSSNNKHFTSDNGVLFNKDKTKLIQYPIGRKSTTYEVPNSVTAIDDYAFYGCSTLTTVTIPNSVTAIDDYAFYGCSGLTSITIPNSVTYIGGDVFAYCI